MISETLVENRRAQLAHDMHAAFGINPNNLPAAVITNTPMVRYIERTAVESYGTIIDPRDFELIDIFNINLEGKIYQVSMNLNPWRKEVLTFTMAWNGLVPQVVKSNDEFEIKAKNDDGGYSFTDNLTPEQKLEIRLATLITYTQLEKVKKLPYSVITRLLELTDSLFEVESANNLEEVTKEILEKHGIAYNYFDQRNYYTFRSNCSSRPGKEFIFKFESIIKDRKSLIEMEMKLDRSLGIVVYVPKISGDVKVYEIKYFAIKNIVEQLMSQGLSVDEIKRMTSSINIHILDC